MNAGETSDSRILRGGKRKEKHLVEEEDALASCSEAQISTDLPLKRSKLVDITEEERAAFYNLIDNPHILQLLDTDSCLLISDKYLLSMVLIYFKRADLTIEEYTVLNFYTALYLANEMEEDKHFKNTIKAFAQLHTDPKSFRNGKVEFFWRIGMQAWVSLEECQQVMEGRNHWMWKRDRPPHHGGAVKEHNMRPEVLYPGMRYDCPLW